MTLIDDNLLTYTMMKDLNWIFFGGFKTNWLSYYLQEAQLTWRLYTTGKMTDFIKSSSSKRDNINNRTEITWLNKDFHSSKKRRRQKTSTQPITDDIVFKVRRILFSAVLAEHTNILATEVTVEIYLSKHTSLFLYTNM